MEEGEIMGGAGIREGSRNINSFLTMLKNELVWGKFRSFLKVDNSTIKPQVVSTLLPSPSSAHV